MATQIVYFCYTLYLVGYSVFPSSPTHKQVAIIRSNMDTITPTMSLNDTELPIFLLLQENNSSQREFSLCLLRFGHRIDTEIGCHGSIVEGLKAKLSQQFFEANRDRNSSSGVLSCQAGRATPSAHSFEAVQSGRWVRAGIYFPAELRLPFEAFFCRANEN